MVEYDLVFSRLRQIEKPFTFSEGFKWSGRRESNPRLNLGKVAFYH